jgi:hypothetical protein
MILLTAAALIASVAIADAQTKNEVITPPPMKQDGSVITPPTTDVDPGIEKAPDQAQIPNGPGKGGAPAQGPSAQEGRGPPRR